MSILITGGIGSYFTLSVPCIHTELHLIGVLDARCHSEHRAVAPSGVPPRGLCPAPALLAGNITSSPRKPRCCPAPSTNARSQAGEGVLQQFRPKALNIFCLSAKSLSHGSLSFFVCQLMAGEEKPGMLRASHRAPKIHSSPQPHGHQAPMAQAASASSQHQAHWRWHLAPTQGSQGAPRRKGPSLPPHYHFLPCSS